MKRKVLVIGGPTAVGKSSIAIKLAKELNGEIVNADSLTVYRHLDIGSAKPPKSQRESVPHHLIDILEPDQDFDAYHYAHLASKAIGEIWTREKLPIVTGGTGLYIKALIHGLPPQIEKDPSLRKELLAKEEGNPGVLHRRLAEIDPYAAHRIHPRDRVRLVRALEIFAIQKRLPSEVWKERNKFLEADFLKIAIIIPRKELYSLIDARVLDMLKRGLVEETKKILARGYTPDIKPLQAIGYKESLKYLEGKLSWNEMVQEIQKKTRHYAKRQISWFKKEGFKWFPPSVQALIIETKNWIEDQKAI